MIAEPDCDGIDLNLGCPQRIARRGKYGAYLMDDLPLIEALVTKLAQVSPLCLDNPLGTYVWMGIIYSCFFLQWVQQRIL